MTPNQQHSIDPFPYTLGLDLGIASIGWAIIRLDHENTPIEIVRLGAHIFESGTEGDASRGRDASRAGPRRTARAMRRQIFRRMRRKRLLLELLIGAGLLPAADISEPEGIMSLFDALDKSLRQTWEAQGNTDHRLRQLLPYRLRDHATKAALQPFEVGRALYHLAQRRGYLSNRRADAAKASVNEAATKQKEKQDDNDNDTPGIVAAGIASLRQEIGDSRTLGSYFATIDPTDPAQRRVRKRYTARDMYETEFEKIWDVQARHHPQMTEELRTRIRRAIFFQRPLRSSKHLIGMCELVPNARRAPLANRKAQRFRLLASLNNLWVRFPDGTERRPTPDERARLIERLQNEGDLPFSSLKTKAWFGRGCSFNLEAGDEKRLVGNRTDARLRQIFGHERWNSLSEDQKDAIVQDLLSFEKPEALAARGAKRWGLDKKEDADAFGALLLEAGYASHSLKAIARLLPRLEEGIEYATARKEEFPGSFEAREPLGLLPIVEKAMGSLRNPAVTRALTEVRKLVNAIIRRYGKPTFVRVELARDLKKSRKSRAEMSAAARKRQAEREEAAALLLKEINYARPSRSDIERVLLAIECGWICPYTGRAFSLDDLVGRHPQVDIEHIWPFSRSLDDGFSNKTLCFADENRDRKRNRTPYEAYATTEAWGAILDRVKRFKGPYAGVKHRRFTATEIPDDFVSRHLSETRYISAACAEYLNTLFGGTVDAHGTKRVFTPSGGLTHALRREWMLDAILSARPEDPEHQKNRSDHRHHAVDAAIVALTDQSTISTLMRAAARADSEGRRFFARIDPPWPDFLSSVQAHVNAINVSCRQRRRVRGKIHADSPYSKPFGPKEASRIRKAVDTLTPHELESHRRSSRQGRGKVKTP